jgi:predicted DNA-binding ribbon-helix-helix protein
MEGVGMNAVIAKRSLVVSQRKTSVSLEDPFWTALKEIAAERRVTLSTLVSTVDRERSELSNLSSALRTFVLAQYRRVPAIAGLPAQIAEGGLARAEAP